MLLRHCLGKGRTSRWSPQTTGGKLALLQIRNVSHSSLSSTTTTAPKKSQEKFRTVQIQFFSTSNFDFPTLAEVEFPRIDILNIANDKALTEENKAPSATSRRQSLIESLSKEVERNVAVIVQRIDSLKSKIQQPDDGGSHGLKSPRKAFETSLTKRWKAAYQREKERHYGIYAEGNNPKKSLNKVTIDDLWEQSMQSNGIEFLLESQYKKVDSVRDMSQSTPSKSFAVVENQTTKSSPMCSPIFGLEITETGLVLEKSTTGSVSYIIDLQENSPSDTEALSSNSAAMATAVHSSSHKSKTITNGILCCLALFATARKNEWALFRSDPKNLGDMKSTHQEERANFDLGELESDFASELLQDSQIKRLLLSSDECNLLLARLLSSPSMKEENILEKGLQFFNEMQRLAATGIEDGGPDANTYRLLFSALPRRLAATGEAAQICKTMASSYVEWNPETLLEAMRVCQGYGDLDTASKLIARALTHHIESPVRVGSCTIFLEMLQAKSMMKEALSFYDEIQKGNVLSPDSEDELLFQLCRWPNRLRHGATIDCTSVLHHVKNAIFEKVMREERPRLQLWFALVERLAQAAKLDPSLENDINQTIRRMLDAYPDAWPGNELLRIGLRTAEVTRDAELIALLLGREVERKLHQETKRKLRVKASDEEELSRLPTIPLVVFRRALEISLQNSDSQSAWAILEQYRYISGSYPSSANTELYGLVVLTNVSVQKYEQAKELLFLMITDKMEPTEELIGTVLHSLVAAGKVEDARKIFDSMTKGIEKLPAPNVTSFNAILAASINAREWDEVIELYGRMKEKGVHPNPQTIQALMLAHLNRDGKTGISSLMKKLLAERAPMDQNTFQLASRIVLPTINGENIDEIRNKARQVGEKEPRLRDASVKMIRSIRVAQVVQKKLQAKAVNTLGTKYPQPNEEWVNAFSDLLDFVQQMEMIGQH